MTNDPQYRAKLIWDILLQDITKEITTPDELQPIVNQNLLILINLTAQTFYNFVQPEFREKHLEDFKKDVSERFGELDKIGGKKE